ncbi:actin-related protein 2/3 complex subunit 3-like [Dermatophagoides pteronyssinus]|uniref:actin-related protein 2/3 complex subunit 3-like n=1 Tax=Dermatophagoides pteronyssinus TaxID=6956 RepID=UPI003F67BE5D
MPAIYHSGCQSKQKIGNMSLLTFRTKHNGPIKSLNNEHLRQEDPIDLDIIDESFYFFKSNVFFSNFEITCESDRNLIYLTLYIIECLKLISKSTNRRQAQQDLINLSQQKFALPGDPKFPLNNIYSKPKNSVEADEMRNYMMQMRQECSTRLIDLIWPSSSLPPSKWWICFARRKFLNIQLNEVDTY